MYIHLPRWQAVEILCWCQQNDNTNVNNPSLSSTRRQQSSSCIRPSIRLPVKKPSHNVRARAALLVVCALYTTYWPVSSPGYVPWCFPPSLAPLLPPFLAQSLLPSLHPSTISLARSMPRSDPSSLVPFINPPSLNSPFLHWRSLPA